ncbi:subtilisin-like protease SBT1.8 [Quercus suber]|uniref:subtilisin-like protease SBT1.8 n=1 Tax=Quercus suber TaxID=58331 RepID=UPI000CE1B021|nr:subtilisin-like protease SBT1.8 [Quercus suber]POE70586.1 subtilisin-like protease sbt1.8 [Quercus suber]
MASNAFLLSLTSALLLLLPLLSVSAMAKQTYIVHMKHQDKPSSYATHHDWYSSQLQSDSSLLYTYTNAYHGFAASLDSDQADSLRRSDSVLGVYEDTLYTLHTTRTPEFLGLNTESDSYNTQVLDQASNDVIIGVLDTGVWPESKSFDDSGLPQIPTRWKGQCESGPDFKPALCNKKLIGARSFSKGYRMASSGGYGTKPKEVVSPRDNDGHGTHTASTAAGSPVANASLLGYAQGTARGMASRSRVASYKVCWSVGCFGSDILAGMDQAISDGVDVLSLSLGGGSAPYYRDTIAIGAFTAVEKGIFVSCSAGNSGPIRASLANVAPWIMTVGAGTIDRDFPAFALLGNKNHFTGVSLYSGNGMGNKPVGLVYNKGNSSASNMCLPGSLEPDFARGKVVVCDRGVNARVEKGAVVRDAGGVGMILANTAASGEELVADSHLLPAVAVGRKVGDMIREYVRSDSNPTAVLSFGGTVLNVKPSPVVAAFSSRGPNMVNPQILKPDVIGPGVNILAAWSEAVGPTGLDTDTRKTQFNIMSGTSMSCPHISGLAALLKAAHPEWSPSAIKSALMTTAYTQDNTNSPLRDAAGGGFSNPLAHGSGHVEPHKALNPGLVYDISIEDYITFLCSLDYTVAQVQTIVKRPNVTCSRKLSDPGQLNYPSFSVLFANKRIVRYTRVLTNVGAAGSVYDVTVGAPTMVNVAVKPTKLVFKSVGEKQRYTVTFVAKRGAPKTPMSEFGSIVWSNAQHQVKSPVAFAWTQ